MFMQSSGPVDRVLIPLWMAVLLWFGAEMRKAAFDGAGVPVHTIVARTASVLRVCADRVQVFLSLAAGRTAARQVGIALLVALPIIIVMCILFA